jgi:hypothetical protein
VDTQTFLRPATEVKCHATTPVRACRRARRCTRGECLDLAGRRAGVAAVLLRPRPAIRGGAASRPGHRRRRGCDGRGSGGRSRGVRRDRAHQWQVGHRRDCRRIRRDAHTPRIDRRSEGRDSRRGRRRRDNRTERRPRGERALRPPRHPARRRRAGLRRPGRIPAGADAVRCCACISGSRQSAASCRSRGRGYGCAGRSSGSVGPAARRVRPDRCAGAGGRAGRLRRPAGCCGSVGDDCIHTDSTCRDPCDLGGGDRPLEARDQASAVFPASQAGALATSEPCRPSAAKACLGAGGSEPGCAEGHPCVALGAESHPCTALAPVTSGPPPRRSSGARNRASHDPAPHRRDGGDVGGQARDLVPELNRSPQARTRSVRLGACGLRRACARSRSTPCRFGPNACSYHGRRCVTT